MKYIQYLDLEKIHLSACIQAVQYQTFTNIEPIPDMHSFMNQAKDTWPGLQALSWRADVPQGPSYLSWTLGFSQLLMERWHLLS